MRKSISKKITFQLRIPENGLSKNREYIVEVDEGATFSEALARVDQKIFEQPEQSPFGKNHVFIRCYLQLFWNPEEDKIYNDIKVFAASAKGFMPIVANIHFNLYDNSEISLTSNAWGWWVKMVNRPDFGRFKIILRKKYGKSNPHYAHYF